MDEDDEADRLMSSGAEFIMADLRLAFTFLEIASTSQVADNVQN